MRSDKSPLCGPEPLLKTTNNYKPPSYERMKNKYIDLIEQTFEFPQDEFSVNDSELNFHDVPLMDIIKQYGTPLKISYLPKISSQIQRAKRLFNVAMADRKSVV